MNHLAILVADDDPVIRKLYQKRLHDADYNVTVATNGVEAMEYIAKQHFDIIITDLVMPGDINGLDVLQRAKEKDNNIEVIMITGHSSVDSAVLAMKRGAVDYLEKPVNFDELFLRLDKINEIKSLVKNADDLREAMDQTEASAAQTIQTLEITVAELRHKLKLACKILRDQTRSEQERTGQVLELLES